MSKTEAQRKADFAEKLAYWRQNGAPGIIRDEACTPIKSMADGKTYDSKSEYRKSLKNQGYQEVGDQKPPAPTKKQSTDEEIVSDIKRVMGEL